MYGWVLLGCTEGLMASVKSLQGTRRSLSCKIFSVPTLSLPLWLCVPFPYPLCRTVGIMHMLGGNTSGTQWTSSSSLHISFILDPWSWYADLWTTIGSGHSMPSTHPSGMQMVRCWVKHPSTLSFGKLFSHSNGVNSTNADWVDTLVSASSLSHKGVISPWG